MRLKELYQKEIINKLKERFSIKNSNAVAKIDKVVLSVGIGEAKENPKIIDLVNRDLAIIAGQKPIITTAKKAISGFKIRQGDKVGYKVTLRGDLMYDFIERLTRITLPRIRDFRGLKESGFDGHGNYNLGIKEHSVFPEIKFDSVEKTIGLQITVSTTTKKDDEAKELLTLMGFPFKSGKSKQNG